MNLLESVADFEGLADLDPAARRLALRGVVAKEVAEPELASTVAELSDAIDGYGPLTRLMSDDSITDVIVNAPDDVWVERDGVLSRERAAFSDRDDLKAFVTRWLERAGTRVDAERPVADARLPCGARLHVVMPPVAPSGPLVSIRKFAREPMSLDRLVGLNAMSKSQADQIRSFVSDRRTIVVSGGTGSGKTTLLNALLELVGSDQRIVTIEETPELRVPGAHIVSLVTKPPTVEGRGDVDAAALVRAALRMRPDRIVVGEVRGAEALDAIAALSTGHRGSMLTVHARSATSAFERLTMLALGGSTTVGEVFVRAQLDQAIEVVVHLARAGSTRVVTEILARDECG